MSRRGEVEFHNVENDPNTIAEIEQAVEEVPKDQWRAHKKAQAAGFWKDDKRTKEEFISAHKKLDSRDLHQIFELAIKGELPKTKGGQDG